MNIVLIIIASVTLACDLIVTVSSVRELFKRFEFDFAIASITEFINAVALMVIIKMLIR